MPERTPQEIAADLHLMATIFSEADLDDAGLLREAASALERCAPAVTREQAFGELYRRFPTYPRASIEAATDAVLRLIDGAASEAKPRQCKVCGWFEDDANTHPDYDHDFSP